MIWCYNKFLLNGRSDKIFILNNNTQVNFKGHWENKFDDNVIDWNLWFDCNFVNNLMPRKWKYFNRKIFYGQVKTDTRLEKINMSNGMCEVCENSKENLEHLLIACRHVYDIWDAVEWLIKPCLSNSYQTSPFIILAGHFQQSVDSKVVNFIPSINRWTLWKFRNNTKYEGNDINEIAKYKMLFRELK